uniref:Uncharacterized protein n=1 Tax=Rhizophora mucronata TaxID=61149 RepID=A0A2P2Q3D6_RHIMU
MSSIPELQDIENTFNSKLTGNNGATYQHTTFLEFN